MCDLRGFPIYLKALSYRERKKYANLHQQPQDMLRHISDYCVTNSVGYRAKIEIDTRAITDTLIVYDFDI